MFATSTGRRQLNPVACGVVMCCGTVVFGNQNLLQTNSIRVFAVVNVVVVGSLRWGLPWSSGQDTGVTFLLSHDAGADVASGCAVAGTEVTVTFGAHPDKLGCAVLVEFGIRSAVRVVAHMVDLDRANGASAGNVEPAHGSSSSARRTLGSEVPYTRQAARITATIQSSSSISRIALMAV